MSRLFLKAAGIRAVKTMCQTAVAMIGTAVVVNEVSWLTVLSASVLAGVVSVLTSIATGLPEVPVIDRDEVEMLEDHYTDDRRGE